MTDGERAQFLAGERPEDVLVYLADAAVSDPEPLEAVGERVDGGVVLVVPGTEARSLFERTAGIDPMAFATEARNTEGTVHPDCTGGVCPADGSGHEARFVFAFAEAQNPEAGGLYAEGDVIHAYVACACGESYADKWVAGDR